MHIFDKADEHFDFPAVGEKPIGIGHRADRYQPLIGMNRCERERGMCRLVVVGCGRRLRRVKEGHVKKNKWTVWVLLLLLLLNRQLWRLKTSYRWTTGKLIDDYYFFYIRTSAIPLSNINKLHCCFHCVASYKFYLQRPPTPPPFLRHLNLNIIICSWTATWHIKWQWMLHLTLGLIFSSSFCRHCEFIRFVRY